MPPWLIKLLLSGLLVLIYATFVEPRLLTIRRVRLMPSSLPANWRGRRIVFFSDIHLGRAFGPAQVRRFVRDVMAEKPDLILFGGDLVEERTPFSDADFFTQILAEFKRLNAPLGCYAIAGNHDRESAFNDTFSAEFLRAAGFTRLINQSVELDGIQLDGLDEAFHHLPQIQNALQGSSGYRIALMHQPDHLPLTAPDHPYNLILSGHAHRGQVTLFGLPLYRVRLGRKYFFGTYRLPDDDRVVDVSAGLGTVHLYLRFCAPPEIVVLTFD